MDPKANIDQQRALAVTLLGKIDTPTDQHDIAPSHERLDTDQAVGRLCQLVLALDQWRAKAGFDPCQVPRRPTRSTRPAPGTPSTRR